MEPTSEQIRAVEQILADYRKEHLWEADPDPVSTRERIANAEAVVAYHRGVSVQMVEKMAKAILDGEWRLPGQPDPTPDSIGRERLRQAGMEIVSDSTSPNGWTVQEILDREG
jgi:hypothetical protein